MKDNLKTKESSLTTRRTSKQKPLATSRIWLTAVTYGVTCEPDAPASAAAVAIPIKLLESHN